jgi:hypothetical protein
MWHKLEEFKLFDFYIRNKYVNMDKIIISLGIIFDLIHMFSKFVNFKFS